MSLCLSKFDQKNMNRAMDKFKQHLKQIDSTLLSMDQIYTIMSHVLYFQACEVVFLEGHQKATYLYTLMFFNVVSYCSNYAKEVYRRRNWTPYVTITDSSQVKHLGMSATKLTLEWTKLLIFVLTAVFIVLTVAFAQEVQGVRTSGPYLLATVAFYLTTDKLFAQEFVQLPLFHRFEQFECREQLFGRIVLKIGAAILAIIAHTTLLVVTWRYKLFVVGFYVNVYLRIQELLDNEVKTILSEESRVKKFLVADKQEILQFSDVCAICLGEMRRARKTRCRHLFHEHCLSLAVDTSDYCPTCKNVL